MRNFVKGSPHKINFCFAAPTQHFDWEWARLYPTSEFLGSAHLGNSMLHHQKVLEVCDFTFPSVQTLKTPILGIDKVIPNINVVKAQQTKNESCEVTL